MIRTSIEKPKYKEKFRVRCYGQPTEDSPYFLEIKKKYGNNAILKGTNFEEGATSIDRNQRIGGHKA